MLSDRMLFYVVFLTALTLCGVSCVVVLGDTFGADPDEFPEDLPDETEDPPEETEDPPEVVVYRTVYIHEVSVWFNVAIGALVAAVCLFGMATLYLLMRLLDVLVEATRDPDDLGGG